MTLKYVESWKIFFYILISAIKSLQIVFVAYIFKRFINFAEKPQGSLLQLVFFAILGLIIFSIASIVYQCIYSNIVASVNIKLKELASNYLVKVQNKNVKIDSSFMTNDLKQVETQRVDSELTIIFNSIQFVAAIVSAIIGSWLLALIFLIASFTPALFQIIFGPMIENKSEKWELANSHYTDTVNETTAGISIVDLYDAEASIIDRLINTAKRMELALMRTNRTKGIATEITTTGAYICGMIIPFAFGIYFVVRGNITLGTFMMIAQLANNFINPIIDIFAAINDVKTTTPIWKRFQEIIAFNGGKTIDENTNVGSFNGLSLKNIGIQMNNKKIFSGVSLLVNSGEKILIEASSGWGKSTLFNILIGNYHASEGTYSINGQDVNGNWNKIHRYFSFIQQKPFVLEDTLKYNITLGRKISNKKINEVTETVGLSELVKEKGWNYKVAKDGLNLSGGQNQRIEIARALVAERPVLLADEATSALDKNLSEKIHQTILKDFSGTVIEIAHKTSDNEREFFNQIIKLG